MRTKGMWIIKNLNGVEKRFKDDESPEAIAWKNSFKQPTIKHEKYSYGWWINVSQAETKPWDRIDTYDSGDQIEKLVREHIDFERMEWSANHHSFTLVDGVKVARVNLRVMFEAGPEDDLGLEETVQDSQNIILERDARNPKKLVFAGY